MCSILRFGALMRLSSRGQQSNSSLLKTPQFIKNIGRQIIVHQLRAVSAKFQFHSAPGRQTPIYPIQTTRHSSSDF
ncbi:hypothetical protein BER93_06750 [Xanthomonas fragariae]|nr:hypothetical protein BER92_06745 [Xanthomonas fragariae]AOD17872.1 hypothetical protein BER93_06750 [Xanthomonas fragariae]ENZ94693.1 hypothetical protein O1K_13818 [Xanthomonas fragariae LMG 25863]